MLFDLQDDPEELCDLGRHPDHAETRARMAGLVLDWALRGAMRITQTDAEIENKGPEYAKGVLIGFWDEAELAAAKAQL